MNKVVLIGRLTRDPNVTYSQGETPLAIARYTLAVNRMKKDEADFISCVAFGKSGEFAEKYLHKGMKIAVTGRIQTGSYEKDGVKHYTTDVVVESHEFCERQGETEEVPTGPMQDVDGFVPMAGVGENEIPFK